MNQLWRMINLLFRRTRLRKYEQGLIDTANWLGGEGQVSTVSQALKILSDEQSAHTVELYIELGTAVNTYITTSDKLEDMPTAIVEFGVLLKDPREGMTSFIAALEDSNPFQLDVGAGSVLSERNVEEFIRLLQDRALGVAS